MKLSSNSDYFLIKGASDWGQANSFIHVYNCSGEIRTTNMLMTDVGTEIIVKPCLLLPLENGGLSGRHKLLI